MRTKYIFWFAGRYLLSRSSNSFISLISWISMLGIMVAVAVLIIVLSVVNGFEEELETKLLIMSGHANIEHPSRQLSQWPSYADIAEDNKRVIAASPYLNGQGMIISGEKISSVVIHGIDPSLESKTSEFSKLMQVGNLSEMKDGTYSIILGIDLAKSLNISVGEKVSLNLVEGISTPLGVFPRTKEFRVIGIFRAGMNEYDRNLVFINIGDAQRLMRMKDFVSGIRLSLTDVYAANEIAREVALSSGGGLIVRDWTQRHVNFFRSIKITKSILFVILLSVIAVAAFNIVSTLVMAVKDKQSDIAILRTSGSSSMAVLKIFVVQGFLIGLLGSVLGVLLGIFVTLNLESLVSAIESIFNIKVLASEVYFISDVPADLRIEDIMMVSSIAFLLAIIATIYPAWSASKILPSEALRHEQ
ncbi:MAG: lipoprotein-releasing ABC transporter permease subunit [Pseudomonadota bacterium]|nr:lipoprotein-releasing ABC transporter permease subunit [Pseudomonadota bacterium]MEC8955921.1 lipoprotein-releasing ABC transporter permease subunit [Pseudomonadota bacterium]